MNIQFHISIEIYRIPAYSEKKKHKQIAHLRGSCFLSSFYPNESNCPLLAFNFVHLESRILENASIPVCQDTSERMYYIVQVRAKSQNQHIYYIYIYIEVYQSKRNIMTRKKMTSRVLIEDPGPQDSPGIHDLTPTALGRFTECIQGTSEQQHVPWRRSPQFLWL